MTVLQQLNSGFSNTTATQGIQDANIILHGDPFSMPAGQVKFALGGEFMHTTDQQLQNTASTAVGPQSVASQTTNLFYGRTVYSAFAEILVPLVSPEMNVPLIQKLDLDISGRFDRYTTYGDTKNPKLGFTWDVTDGLRGRGSFGTSFIVPAFASGGQSKTGITSQSATSTGGTPSLAIPFNDTTYNGGAGVAGTFVANAASCAAAGSTPVDGNNAAQAAPYTNAVACLVNSGNSPGIQYAAGGKPGLRPEIGMTYSAGFDFDLGKFFPVLEGLSGEVTYYQAKYAGLVTSIGLQTAQPGLTFFAPPGGWTQTSPFIVNVLSTGYPLTSTLPSTIYTFFDGRQTNAYTLWQNGLDYGLRYVFNTDWGTFHAGINGNEILRFTQRNEGPNNPLIDIKNGKAGSSGRFAGQEMTWRATAGWNQGPYQLQLAFNFQSPYFASVTAFPYNRVTSFDPAAQAGVTAGNLQKIEPLETLDLTAGYVIPAGWYHGLEGTEITLSVTNLLDTDPPFQDNANGFGPGSQLGRLVTVSLKKAF
jgi:iron complex outermembrane receptor protein